MTTLANTFMVAITLNYTFHDNTVVVVEESELPDTRILFLNRIMNDMGEPISESFTGVQS